MTTLMGAPAPGLGPVRILTCLNKLLVSYYIQTSDYLSRLPQEGVLRNEGNLPIALYRSRLLDLYNIILVKSAFLMPSDTHSCRCFEILEKRTIL